MYCPGRQKILTWQLKKTLKHQKILFQPFFLSWWCLAVLDYIVLYSIVLHLTLVGNVTYFPILVWQKWTKYWTKVVIHGNSVHTKVTSKGITNQSTLEYMTARLNMTG